MLSQVLANSIVGAAEYALIGISFLLATYPSRFLNFGHAGVFTAGAYSTYLFSRLFGLPVLTAVPLGVISASGCAWLSEAVVYRRLRRVSASPLIQMLASLGIYLLIQNGIALFAGDEPKMLRVESFHTPVNVGSAVVTPIRIAIICSGMILVPAAAVWLSKTKAGRNIRAVGMDCELATAFGVPSDNVILAATVLGSALMGLAGALVALDTDMTPTMGLNAFMMGIVTVVVGGFGSVPGIALGALLLSLAQQFGVWRIDSRWQQAAAFVVLCIFLVLRPQGFLGKPLRKTMT